MPLSLAKRAPTIDASAAAARAADAGAEALGTDRGEERGELGVAG